MVKNISTIILNASAERVWEVLTKPEYVKQWQYGSDLITDLKPGSDIRFNSEWEGQFYEQWGKIIEVKPNELLKYSLLAPRPDLEDKPENYYVMSYVLSRENGVTKLEIIKEDNRPNAVQEDPEGEENPVLQMLKKIAEQ